MPDHADFTRGVPTVLIELPLRYTHSRNMNLDNVKKAARLVAQFITSMEGMGRMSTY